MNEFGHRSRAQRYSRSSEMLRRQGLLLEGGEIAWGGLIHALNAMAHKHHRRHRATNFKRQEFLMDMARLGVLDGSAVNDFGSVGLALHERFYRAEREDPALSLDIVAAQNLIERLLAAQ